MPAISRQFLPEEVAAHLREGIRRGRWSASFPGVPQLAGELDGGRHTVEMGLALKLLAG